MTTDLLAAAAVPALPSVDLMAHAADLFNIDAALTEEERAIRATVRAFVDEKVLPVIGDCYVHGRFPTDLIPGLEEIVRPSRISSAYSYSWPPMKKAPMR